MIKETITLYFKEGSSDKVYTANLEENSGWIVTFAYGRRGSTMTTGTKTSSPVEFEKAKKIYDKLVSEKMAKGYTPGEDGTLYRHTSSESRDTGVHVQLLNEMSESDVERLIQDDDWGAQEKMDGRRQVIKKTGTSVIGINRKGLSVGLCEPAMEAALALEGDVTIDGEAVGDMLYAFDILSGDQSQAYHARYARLAKALPNTGAIKLVPLATTTAKKRELVDRVRSSRGEGVVFKRLSAPYTAGRPNSGGDQLKYKFYATGSFIVSRVNEKRSVELEILVNGKRSSIGNVTITPNKAIPPVGSIVEIRYLYCFKGGCLYQPTFLEVRDDIEASACNDRQLKLKPEEDDQ